MNFLNNPAVEIALSLVVIWAFFAILCSFGQEIIAEIIGERGRFLKKKMMDQLHDFSNEVNWATIFYSHGAVDLLSRAENKPTSEIDPKLFGEVVIETVANSHIVQQYIRAEAPPDSDESVEAQQHRAFKKAYREIGYSNQILKDFKAATMVLNLSDVMKLFAQSLHAAEVRAGSPWEYYIVGSLKNELPNYRDVRRVEYETKVYNNLVESLCNWYNIFTERVSLWYKKKMRLRLFYIGIILSTLFHVDSIQLFKFFRMQPAARANVISYFNENMDRIEEAYIAPADTASQERRNKMQRELRSELNAAIEEAQLPIGWDKAKKADSDSFIGYWLFKILGFVITALAASYGGPFWFQLFRRFTKPSSNK